MIYIDRDSGPPPLDADRAETERLLRAIEALDAESDFLQHDMQELTRKLSERLAEIDSILFHRNPKPIDADHECQADDSPARTKE